MKKFKMNFNGRSLVLGERTLIMGIVNATPDSFSDGGLFAETEKAVAHGLEMARQGADIIDVGGESTRPFSDPVTEEEELARVIPVIKGLAASTDALISIDTTKAVVAEKAVEAGAHIINDISALRQDPAMASVAAESGAPVILMHMAGTPKNMQANPVYSNVVTEVRDFLAEAADRACDAGVSRDLIMIDPGIGFGKTVTHNLLLIKELDSLAELDLPVLLGPSRKSFIRKILEKELEPLGRGPNELDMELGTLSVLSMAVKSGVHVVRVHDVLKTKTAMLIADSVAQAR